MKKLPAFVLLALVVGMIYLSCSDPEVLKPHNPRLTPSLTATETTIPSASPIELASVTPSRTPIETSTPTLVPTAPPPTTVREGFKVSPDDIDALARLCVIEARGMDEVRSKACLSIVSTVMTRAYNRIISDGTISGTIGWGCTEESEICQFPAHVLASGCEGLLPEACAWNYPDDIFLFTVVVRNYFEGEVGPCSGYIYYGITEQDPPECHLESKNGQFLNWHGRVK